MVRALVERRHRRSLRSRVGDFVEPLAHVGDEGLFVEVVFEEVSFFGEAPEELKRLLGVDEFPLRLLLAVGGRHANHAAVGLETIAVDDDSHGSRHHRFAVAEADFLTRRTEELASRLTVAVRHEGGERRGRLLGLGTLLPGLETRLLGRVVALSGLEPFLVHVHLHQSKDDAKKI